MTSYHMFPEERFAGTVSKVEGSFISVLLASAGRLSRSMLGQHLGMGEVGEFFLVEVAGMAIFGRLVDVSWKQNSEYRTINAEERVAEGRIQLLSTLDSSGNAQRGVARYPRLGDRVFVAGDQAIGAVIAAGSEKGGMDLLMGHLSIGDGVEVHVPIQNLFGRHLAVVGATGSGKSWTLAHLVDSVRARGGKMVLIDATGEFHTLKNSVRHVAFGSLDGEDEAKLVSLPHWLMREQDRNAFISPSAGSQMPKLRAAVRSLRLSHANRTDHRNRRLPHIQPDGQVIKAGLSRGDYERASAYYAKVVENPHSPFDLSLLAKQVINECLWPPRSNPANFGDANLTEQGYVSSMVSRIEDLLQTDEIMGVISGASAHTPLFDELESWLYDSSASILRISLRNLTFGHHLREIAVNIIGHKLLEGARAGWFRSRPLVVALDEAHQFFNVTVGDELASTKLDAFELIAKEGRKYGLTVCMATQRPGDLPPGVLSQVGMMIVHRLADGRDRQRVEEAAAELDLSATRLLPGLVPGEALLMGANFPVPVSVRITKPSAPPESEGPRFATGWAPLNPSSTPELREMSG